jgi:hypothetical protein
MTNHNKQVAQTAQQENIIHSLAVMKNALFALVQYPLLLRVPGVFRADIKMARIVSRVLMVNIRWYKTHQIAMHAQKVITPKVTQKCIMLANVA